MKDLACIKAADVVWLQRDYSHSVAVTGDELDLVRRTLAVHEDNGSNIAYLKPMLRKRPTQYD